MAPEEASQPDNLFQKWEGGERPTNKLVDVVYKRGPQAYRKDPKKLRWSHIGARDDIEYYRESAEK